jgi:hypothetical protein
MSMGDLSTFYSLPQSLSSEVYSFPCRGKRQKVNETNQNNRKIEESQMLSLWKPVNLPASAIKENQKTN